MEWYPWYPQLYQQKTLSLTLAEDAAYRRLLDAYMTSRQPLPDDDSALARLIGIGVDEWRAIAPKVREYFKAKSGKLWNQRCDTELLRQDRRTKKHSEISKKGAAARWNKNKDLHADGKPTALPSVSRTDATGQDKTRENSKRGTRIKDDWHPNDKSYEVGYEEGYSDGEINRSVKDFINHFLESGKPKKNWDRTFYAWLRSGITHNAVMAWRRDGVSEIVDGELTDEDRERLARYEGLKVV